MSDRRAAELAHTLSDLLARILREQPDLSPVQAATVAIATGATLARELRALVRPEADTETRLVDLVRLVPVAR